MAPIIRTCSAVALALCAMPVAAQTAGDAALDAYVQGRLLDAAGAGGDAASAYAIALTGAPADERVATRAYRQAIEAGDKALALRAARALAAQQKLPGDGRLLLYVDAISRNDWRGASIQLDAMADGNFDFLVPIFRGWVAFGARDGDPLAPLTGKAAEQGLTAAYAREQAVYLRMAMARANGGARDIASTVDTDVRGLWQRLGVAARLQQLKDSEAALALLSGNDPAVISARAVVSAGRPLDGAVTTPADAASVLFARLARDLLRDNASATALTLARLASFAAPDDAQAGLILAQSLSAAGFQQPALATLMLWKDDPIFASARRDVEFGALQRLGRNDDALAMAKAVAAAPDANLFDAVRLGDALLRQRLHKEAAAAYRSAITLAEANGGESRAHWNLWLAYGGALDSAGDWAAAKPALQKAVALAPEQPAALNHLGYAMLERRDDLTEATRLVAKASALRPEDPAITDSLGWAFFLRGQTAESIAVLERAVASDPTEAALSEHLGDAYWAAGRRVDARYAWNAALIQAEGDDAVAARIKAKIADGLK